MTFMTLDTEAAKQADQTGKFIKETGKYIGRFIKAEALTATTGTKGVAFTFESESGQTANFSIYIMKTDGEKLQSYKTLNAIMACLKLRSVSSPVTGVAMKYDFDAKQDVQYQAPLLLDLMNKQIGIVLQSCEYEKQTDRQPNGEYGWKIEIQGAFEAATELTAGEILAGKKVPEVLATVIANLHDRPLKNKSGARSTQGYQGGTGMHDSNQSSGGPAFDDDIPFAPIPRKALYSI